MYNINVRIFNTVLHIISELRRDWRARVLGRGGETVRRKIVWAGLFLNISTAVHAAAAAVVVRDSHAGHISLGRPENAIYTDAGGRAIHDCYSQIELKRR